MATERVERRLAAILAAEVAGYSRLMSMDEEGTHERLKGHFRELIDPKITEHRGRIVKNTGDGLLAEFPSVVDAVRCAAEIQSGMINRNADVPEDKRILFRMGVNLGDVIVEPEDIFGDDVNIAARLEALAEPGGICISHAVRDRIGERLPYSFEDIGEQSVKNIAHPLHVYRVRFEGDPKARRTGTFDTVPKPPLCLPNKASIAVLPFQNMSGDPEQEYFADGMVEEIITALSRIRWLFVIARNSSFTYKDEADRREANRARARGALCARRLGAQGGRSCAYHCAINRRGHWYASLGRSLRRFPRRRFRPPGQSGLQRCRCHRAGVAGRRDCPFGWPSDHRSDSL